MALEIPSSLTPSKVNSFKECGYSFKLSVIDKVPQPQNQWAVRGTLAHRTLDRLYFEVPKGQRSKAVAKGIFEKVWQEAADNGELDGLNGHSSHTDWLEEFRASSLQMVSNDFEVEDPNEITAIGTEILLEFSEGDMRLRGIIDRLDLNDDGSLTITDYKTGKVPGAAHEKDKLVGVQFYAFLCEKVLGVRPVSVQLIYLRDAITITAHPTAQTVSALRNQTQAIWRAVVTACERDDFRPRVSRLCTYCSYQQMCPARTTTALETNLAKNSARD
ncbi:MAG: PD-(D/E)XK nuclease family protein [Acidimicrobiaceae bacterium]|nr:PD-(D/E)XK nuclease family protein [Acidimicrobiaceae bacterium]